MKMSLHALLIDQLGPHTVESDRLDRYLQCFKVAMERHPPPFGNDWYGDTYRKCAINPFWLSQSLISNSVKEGNGARDLWRFSGRVKDEELKKLVMAHAIDEARHALLYVAILRQVFPNALTADDKKAILGVAPRFDRSSPPDFEKYGDHKVVDILIQINFGEFRTRIHQLLMQPVLEAICGAERSAKLSLLLLSIANDELRHLAYTAREIERRIALIGLHAVEELFEQRLVEFNRLTMTEVGEQAFSG